MKHCNACGRDLPIETFSLDRTTADGHRYYCKECDKHLSFSRKYDLEYKFRRYSTQDMINELARRLNNNY